MIFSFAVSGICLTAALVYTLSGLESMHRTEEDIARKDLAAITLTIRLRDSILTQERSLGRYRILKELTFRELFDQNALQFTNTLVSLAQISQDPKIQSLDAAYKDYLRNSQRIFGGEAFSPHEPIQKTAERVESIIGLIRDSQQDSLVRKLELANKQKTETVTRSITLALSGVLVSFIIAVLQIYFFAKSISKLQKATHRIAKGDFDYDPQIPPGDEIGTLASDFTRMALRLKELEQMSLDASPLTRLPGNIAIERAIHQRLRGTAPFAICYLDLDNFKSYNDRYGYIKASELIKEAGRVIYDSVQLLGDTQAFVGHIGGDDFVVIIRADYAEAACQSVIHAIDALVPAYYSLADRQNGAIEGVDRYGVPRSFPLVSISISALICTPGRCGTAAEIATAAAQLKDQVKKESGSNYCIVSRGEVGDGVL
jgi:diguanylate cyclase (GGDEF)-like protein